MCNSNPDPNSNSNFCYENNAVASFEKCFKQTAATK